MKKKVSDFIADFFVNNGISDVFTVVGGGAMHLNDSLGHKPGLRCTYNHHEQASAIAAEAYYRVNNKMATVCVTSGPGAINALNGVAGAYMDSIPMLVISGQCKLELTIKRSGLNLRTLGNQEFDIISALDKMTKYAVMIENPNDIAWILEKAFFTALSDRPGPCWIDIPLNIQGAIIETDELEHYKSLKVVKEEPAAEGIDFVVNKIFEAERPVIYAGNGINIADGRKELLKVAEKYDIPIVTCWDSIDLINTDSEYYAGRGGIMGDRSGNFAVQNSDLVIAIGNRLNIYQVGYDVSTWARSAYVIAVDADSEELKKKTARIDKGICCDAKLFMQALLSKNLGQLCSFDLWKNQCSKWKNNYPVLQNRMKENADKVNVYNFIDSLSRNLKSNAITVVGNGSASVVGSQTYYIGNNQRFIMNCALSSMGYDLPAAIGASRAASEDIICIAGDGSIMMNLQELQTIVTNNLNIKVFIINNEGYHQIRLTQMNMFNADYVGIGPQSGDVGFPDFKKLADAFGLSYYKLSDNGTVSEGIKQVLKKSGPFICEVVCDTVQVFEPKSSAKRLDDGRIISPPLEDLAPFLSREELKSNMYID